MKGLHSQFCIRLFAVCRVSVGRVPSKAAGRSWLDDGSLHYTASHRMGHAACDHSITPRVPGLREGCTKYESKKIFFEAKNFNSLEPTHATSAHCILRNQHAIVC